MQCHMVMMTAHATQALARVGLAVNTHFLLCHAYCYHAAAPSQLS